MILFYSLPATEREKTGRPKREERREEKSGARVTAPLLVQENPTTYFH
jgi:hypothetical protein